MYRFPVEQLVVSPTQLDLFQRRPSMGYIPTLVDVVDAHGIEHRPWFEDQMHASGRIDVFCVVRDHSAYCPICGHWIMLNLSDAARSVSMSADEVRKLFCADDPRERANAYGIVAGYHGWDNFDSYPLKLTEKQLDERWR